MGDFAGNTQQLTAVTSGTAVNVDTIPPYIRSLSVCVIALEASGVRTEFDNVHVEGSVYQLHVNNVGGKFVRGDTVFGSSKLLLGVVESVTTDLIVLQKNIMAAVRPREELWRVAPAHKCAS